MCFLVFGGDGSILVFILFFFYIVILYRMWRSHNNKGDPFHFSIKVIFPELLHCKYIKTQGPPPTTATTTCLPHRDCKMLLRVCSLQIVALCVCVCLSFLPAASVHKLCPLQTEKWEERCKLLCTDLKIRLWRSVTEEVMSRGRESVFQEEKSGRLGGGEGWLLVICCRSPTLRYTLSADL